jgi:hypothetical protein
MKVSRVELFISLLIMTIASVAELPAVASDDGQYANVPEFTKQWFKHPAVSETDGKAHA